MSAQATRRGTVGPRQEREAMAGALLSCGFPRYVALALSSRVDRPVSTTIPRRRPQIHGPLQQERSEVSLGGVVCRHLSVQSEWS